MKKITKQEALELTNLAETLNDKIDAVFGSQHEFTNVSEFLMNYIPVKLIEAGYMTEEDLENLF